MVKQIFKIRIALKSPDAKACANLDFRELASDIKEAADVSNRKHGYKKISILEVMQKSIFLELEIQTESGVKNVGRELSTFSRSLYNTYEWKRFSSTPNRLFMVTETEEIIQDINLEDLIEYSNPIEKSNLTDEEMLHLIKFVVEFQNAGDADTIERRKRTILNIKKFLLECM